MQSTPSAHKALGFYVVLARDITDYLDLIREEKDLEALRILHDMLKRPDPRDPKLNDMGANLLKNVAKERGFSLE